MKERKEWQDNRNSVKRPAALPSQPASFRYFYEENWGKKEKRERERKVKCTRRDGIDFKPEISLLVCVHTGRRTMGGKERTFDTLLRKSHGGVKSDLRIFFPKKNTLSWKRLSRLGSVGLLAQLKSIGVLSSNIKIPTSCFMQFTIFHWALAACLVEEGRGEKRKISETWQSSEIVSQMTLTDYDFFCFKKQPDH